MPGPKGLTCMVHTDMPVFTKYEQISHVCCFSLQVIRAIHTLLARLMTLFPLDSGIIKIFL